MFLLWWLCIWCKNPGLMKFGLFKFNFCPNLVVLASIGGDLPHGQAENRVDFYIYIQFDVEGQGQSTPLNNRDLNQGVLHCWSKFSDPSLNG